MVRRYAIPVAVVIVVALAAGYLAGRRVTASYSGTCLVRFAVPPTTASGTNYFDVQQAVAAAELGRLLRGPLYSDAGRVVGMDASKLASETSVSEGTLATWFQVSVKDRDARRAPAAANAVCQQVVVQLQGQRSAERQSDIARIDQQLIALESRQQQLKGLPSPTPAQSSELASVSAAIASDQTQFSASLAMPDDIVEQLGEATLGRQAITSRKRSLEVALGAIPLACFLLVLISEEMRRVVRAGAAPA